MKDVALVALSWFLLCITSTQSLPTSMETFLNFIDKDLGEESSFLENELPQEVALHLLEQPIGNDWGPLQGDVVTPSNFLEVYVVCSLKKNLDLQR